MPRERQRAGLHHEPQFYRLRNHLVDFLVERSAQLSMGRAPMQPPLVTPGLNAESSAESATLPRAA
jgi:nitrate/nitrite transport system ATP-binding protein